MWLLLHAAVKEITEARVIDFEAMNNNVVLPTDMLVFHEQSDQIIGITSPYLDFKYNGNPQ